MIRIQCSVLSLITLSGKDHLVKAKTAITHAKQEVEIIEEYNTKEDSAQVTLNSVDI